MRSNLNRKLCVFTICFFLAAFTAYAQSGVIRELSGTVELRNAGAANFAAASLGARVNEDTVISTGFNSSALIEVGSALIAVRPLTRLSLTEIRSAAGNETLNMNLQAGRIRVDLNPPVGTRASMAVVGPQSTASVRGTTFEIDILNIDVEYGAVRFRGNNSRTHEFVVFGGSGSSLTRQGLAQNPLNTGRSRLNPSRPGVAARTSPGSIGGNAAIVTGGSGPGSNGSNGTGNGSGGNGSGGNGSGGSGSGGNGSGGNGTPGNGGGTDVGITFE